MVITLYFLRLQMKALMNNKRLATHFLVLYLFPFHFFSSQSQTVAQKYTSTSTYEFNQMGREAVGEMCRAPGTPKVKPEVGRVDLVQANEP
jgi:hypothetical protein